MQPSLCVPWVRQNVTRELLQETFSPFGSVRQVDLVPKGDHFLCFVHFHSWNLDSPVACAVRARLLNPPSPDHKESVYYMHPTLGRQRWLFARSWVSPAPATMDGGMGHMKSTMMPMPALPMSSGMPSSLFPPPPSDGHMNLLAGGQCFHGFGGGSGFGDEEKPFGPSHGGLFLSGGYSIGNSKAPLTTGGRLSAEWDSN